VCAARGVSCRGAEAGGNSDLHFNGIECLMACGLNNWQIN